MKREVSLKRIDMDTLFFSRTDNSSKEGKVLSLGLSLDEVVLFALLLFSNTHLLTGQFNNSLVYFPSSIIAGEWWRLITHPFVHVSWYHLLLDGGAFFLLYRELKANSLFKRIYYIIFCSAVSLIITQIFSPMIYSKGLCGLSGVAHGLMIISGLEMIRKKKDFHLGLTLAALVILKSVYELFSGDVIFSFMHMGLCGIPVAASHAGGVISGILAYYIGSIINISHKHLEG